MRKLLTAFISFVIALAVCGACAEGENDGQILFRGIPWGTSYTEIMGMLPEGIEMIDPYKDQYLTPINSMMAHVKDGDRNLWEYIGIFIRISDFSPVKTVRVAGYDANDLRMYFAYTVGPDGRLDTDLSHCRLYYADYNFSSYGEDTDIMQADLAAKMTALYGEAFYADGVYYWFGKDATIASLTRSDANFGVETLRVSYGIAAGDEWRREAYEAALRRDPLIPDDSTEGL